MDCQAITRARISEIAVLAGVMLTFASMAAGVDELYDRITQIQFAYYAGDTRSLQQQLEQLIHWEGSGELQATKSYYIGYAQWKLAQSMAERDKKSAAAAADACTDNLDRTVELIPKAAEVYAMQAACFDLLSSLRILRAPFYELKAQKNLEKALTLAPANPRVILIEALHERKLAKSADDKTRVYLKLAQAAEAFEAAQPTSTGAPDWGQAESLVYLGIGAIERGDTLAGRNALEHALVIAPDYRWAQQVLSNLSAH